MVTSEQHKCQVEGHHAANRSDSQADSAGSAPGALLRHHSSAWRRVSIDYVHPANRLRLPELGEMLVAQPQDVRLSADLHPNHGSQVSAGAVVGLILNARRAR